MDEVEQAVGAWQRIYAQLMAAQQRTSTEDDDGEPRRDPLVVRLKEQEELALRAVHSALTSASRRGGVQPGEH